MSYRVLRAIRDGFSPAVDESYFSALFDTEEEAKAKHRLHVLRARSASKPDHTEFAVPVDGGD